MKRGRPRSSNPKIQAKFRIDVKTLEQIEYLAVELQISRSELVRRAIREFLGTLKKQGVEIPY
ncbi:ribbon-helix-helix protein, CopG family [Persephonella sp.]